MRSGGQTVSWKGKIGRELGRRDAERAGSRETAARSETLGDKEDPIIHQK